MGARPGLARLPAALPCWVLEWAGSLVCKGRWQVGQQGCDLQAPFRTLTGDGLWASLTFVGSEAVSFSRFHRVSQWQELLRSCPAHQLSWSACRLER